MSSLTGRKAAEKPSLGQRLSKAGLLLILLLGVIVTPLWICAILWALFETALWLVG